MRGSHRNHTGRDGTKEKQVVILPSSSPKNHWPGSLSLQRGKQMFSKVELAWFHVMVISNMCVGKSKVYSWPCKINFRQSSLEDEDCYVLLSYVEPLYVGCDCYKNHNDSITALWVNVLATKLDHLSICVPLLRSTWGKDGTPERCPLMFTCMPWHTCAHTNIHK